MPELCVGERCWTVPAASNLLDALNAAGCGVPYSCRAGSCHACLVRCLEGQPEDAMPEALGLAQREQGWRLACQCRVSADLRVAVFDPSSDGLPARVCALAWFGDVLRLRLRPERPLRYQAGQHLVLWLDGVARPYSLASLPGEDDFLEFHLDCRRPGAFCDKARRLAEGDELRLGELRGGALHYDPDWQERPLWLLAAGTGLAPLWGILREALRQGHQGGIRVLHVTHDRAGQYLAGPLADLADRYPRVSVEWGLADQLEQALAGLRLSSRQTVALACGAPGSVERFARRLFIAGLPRNQLFADVFLEHA
ncbi:iron-sulfur-binding ferredoxin reductase [Pseudomonas sp. S 311-6]|uniref:iron-sulfur-binding ferredoxin reductase n=1 Tax=Pseudomonas TaxID=286 RepID=UPI001CE422E2|nr:MULTISPECIES: iron-sulfur-binding ferredoxin reductase [Pseudomonas]MCO7635411.1 iron-sulfur-binding ferredoxin reductase [Pseudomonas sp. S 311-6]MCO7563755.1 iron-sulfur-binding ferredoxin reductase [Pseudomonas mosselii]MCO7595180.1 iron-sulfur-binding ferredoxin reductase [Pseudomonas guariconensis]MCO7618454.1 iron-sulfur-binding ferredoxin reductase [Pseudomonas guariconensis]MCO7631579.1 iron-sulfur-binding ferredoxin reductase [Pseudomonas guariconensis]